MTIEEFKKDNLTLEYTNGIVRVKKNKQAKKFIGRNYPKGNCLAKVFDLKDGDVLPLTVDQLFIGLRSCKTLIDLSLEEISKTMDESSELRVFSTNKRTKQKVAKLMAFPKAALDKHRTTEGLFFSVDMNIVMKDNQEEEDEDLFASF
jgi:hypothetical protein